MIKTDTSDIVIGKITELSAYDTGKGIHPGEKPLRKAINATIDKLVFDKIFAEKLKQELIDAICKALWAGI